MIRLLNLWLICLQQGKTCIKKSIHFICILVSYYSRKSHLHVLLCTYSVLILCTYSATKKASHLLPPYLWLFLLFLFLQESVTPVASTYSISLLVFYIHLIFLFSILLSSISEQSIHIFTDLSLYLLKYISK